MPWIGTIEMTIYILFYTQNNSSSRLQYVKPQVNIFKIGVRIDQNKHWPDFIFSFLYLLQVLNKFKVDPCIEGMKDHT